MAGASVLIGLVLALSPTGGDPPSDAALLDRAAAAFREGVALRDRPVEAHRRFRAAAEGYATLRRGGAGGAALCRNEGNAWLLAGDLPRAVLAYRLGLQLAPNNADLRATLEQARAQVVYPTPDAFGRPAADARPPWLPVLPPWTLAVPALAAYALGWLALTRWWMMRRGRLLVAGCAALVAATALGVAWYVLEAKAEEESQRPLVVIADDGVLLRRGNGLSYPPRYEVPVNRGVEARLLLTRGEWVKIELTGGETGWVPRAYLVGVE